MARRRRRVSTKEEDSTSGDQINRISMLPDEILVNILSFLTLKEAMFTSVLSRRWRYLWIFTPKLDFDGTESLMKVKEKATYGTREQVKHLLVKEQKKYVRWVDHGILRNSTIEEFRVFFNLTEKYERNIDKWLTSALARKVQRLELNLTDRGCTRTRKYDECYSFPSKLLCDSIDFNNLKKISMNYVNVNGEALEFFLRHCPLLEQLSVSESGELSSLKVTGPLSSFKRLEISSCNNLNSVEICGATNLVYLKYKGPKIHFFLENAPELVELYVGGKLTHRMEDVLSLFSRFLPQLEILTLDKFDLISWMDAEIFGSAAKMSNLKQFIVKIDIDNCHNLLALTSLIRDSPFLEKFVLEPSLSFEDEDDDEENWDGELKKIVRSYPSLKEVEFLGYYGVNDEVELIIHFLENAAALKIIRIDTHKHLESPYDYTPGHEWQEIVSRSHANELIKKVPPRINLEIL